MASLLLVLHGMGTPSDDWGNTFSRQLDGLAGEYGYGQVAAREPISKQVSIKPISYNRVFSKLVQEWGRSVTEFDQFAKAHGMAVPKVLSWLQHAGELEKNFFWTHVVDVLLYRFFSIVTAEVRLRVRKAIADALVESQVGGEPVQASVLGYSLGTSVAHDSLALLGTQPIDGNPVFTVGSFQFANVFMVANVSRILETDPGPYTSVVHPSSIDPDHAYCRRFYNFRHRLDPFALPRAFKPVNWGDRFLAVEDLDRVLQFDVHALEHYVDDPRVHVPLLRGLLGPIIPDEEFVAARAVYEAKAELPCIEELRRFRTQLNQLLAVLGTADDPQALIIAGSHFLAAAKEARDACR